MSTEIDYELELTESRYEIIDKVLQGVYTKPGEKLTWTELLDHVLLNKYLAIPIFVVILWAMFQFTFEVAAPLMEVVKIGFNLLANLIKFPHEIGWCIHNDFNLVHYRLHSENPLSGSAAHYNFQNTDL